VLDRAVHAFLHVPQHLGRAAALKGGLMRNRYYFGLVASRTELTKNPRNASKQINDGRE
jgi:hypothetical protein